jgi:hypothetical protein
MRLGAATGPFDPGVYAAIRTLLFLLGNQVHNLLG